MERLTGISATNAEGRTIRELVPDILTLHELATNARKSGALTVSSGRLDITWDERHDERNRHWLDLVWQESGVKIEPARQQPLPASGGMGAN